MGTALLFLSSTWGRALSGGIAVLLILLSVYGWGRSDGSSACEARWRTAVIQERARQAAANEAAKQAEARRIAALQAEIRSREQLIEELVNDANNDDGAAGCGLTGAGSLRIDRFR